MTGAFYQHRDRISPESGWGSEKGGFEENGGMRGIWGLGAEWGRKEGSTRCSGLWAGPFCKPEVEERWACEVAGSWHRPPQAGPLAMLGGRFPPET